MVREVRPRNTYAKRKPAVEIIRQNKLNFSEYDDIETLNLKRGSDENESESHISKRKTKNIKYYDDDDSSDSEPVAELNNSYYREEVIEEEPMYAKGTTLKKQKNKSTVKKREAIKGDFEITDDAENLNERVEPVNFDCLVDLLDPNDALRLLSSSELDLLTQLDISSTESVNKFVTRLCREMKYSPTTTTQQDIKEACSTIHRLGKNWTEKTINEISNTKRVDDLSDDALESKDKDIWNLVFEIPSNLEHSASKPGYLNKSGLKNFEGFTPKIKTEKGVAKRVESLEIVGVAHSDDKFPIFKSEPETDAQFAVSSKPSDVLEAMKLKTDILIEYLEEYDRKLTHQISKLSQKENELQSNWILEKKRFVSKVANNINELKKRDEKHSNETKLHHLVSWEFLQQEENIMEENNNENNNKGGGSLSSSLPFSTSKSVSKNTYPFESVTKQNSSVLATKDFTTENGSSYWNDNAKYLASKEKVDFQRRLKAAGKSIHH